MRRNWIGRAVMFGGVLAMAGCSPAASPDEAGAPQETANAELIGQGETIAQSLCAGCHAIGETGDSPHADAVPFRQLSLMYPVETLAEPLSEGIIVGHPDMPEWQFEPQDTEALLAYIESIQAPQET